MEQTLTPSATAVRPRARWTIAIARHERLALGALYGGVFVLYGVISLGQVLAPGHFPSDLPAHIAFAQQFLGEVGLRHAFV